MEHKAQEWRQYFIACIATFSVFTSCYAMGWTSPIVIKLGNPEESPLPDLITVDEEAWIGSLLTIGAMFGPFINGVIISKLGRKWALMMTSVPMLASWTLLAVSTSLPMIYAARVVGGLYVGMSFTVSALYLGEIATNERRGAVNAILGVGMNGGFLLAYCIGPFFSYAVVAHVGLALSVVNFVISSLAPESPYYHLAKGDIESAGVGLMQLRGKSREGVQAELDKLYIEVKESMNNTAKFIDTFRGNNRTAVLLSCGLLMGQQLSGINAVLFYMTNIFEAAGTALDSAISTIIIGAVQLLVALVTPLIVDRLGRRLLLLISCGGMVVSHSFLGAYFYLDGIGNPIVASIGFLPLVCLVLMVTMHVAGLGPIAFMYAAEVIPAEVRSAGMAIVMSYFWIMTFLVTRFFGPVAQAVGMGPSFWIFAGCCLVTFVYILFCIPETKGKSLHEIQAIIKRGGIKNNNSKAQGTSLPEQKTNNCTRR